MMMLSKVVVLANKWWEATALVSVLENTRDIKEQFSASPKQSRYRETAFLLVNMLKVHGSSAN